MMTDLKENSSGQEKVYGLKVGDIVSGCIYMKRSKELQKIPIFRFNNRRIECIYRDPHGYGGWSFKLSQTDGERSKPHNMLDEVDADEIFEAILTNYLENKF